MNGTIVRLNEPQGFGFINGEDGTDRFFHHSALRGVRFADLRQNMRVTFDPTVGERGPRAEEVRVVA